MSTRPTTEAAPPATRPPRRRPTHPPKELMHTRPQLPEPGHPAVTSSDTPTLVPAGQTRLVEPHPWGAPVPPGHPGYRPPTQVALGAFARWFIYLTVLALVTVVVALVALAATQPDTPGNPATGHTTTITAPVGDRFVQSMDRSRYHGPALAADEGAGR